jgi:hypothetical protein
MLDLACATGRAVRLSGPILMQTRRRVDVCTDCMDVCLIDCTGVRMGVRTGDRTGDRADDYRAFLVYRAAC